jgi:hypothetical protein
MVSSGPLRKRGRNWNVSFYPAIKLDLPKRDGFIYPVWSNLYPKPMAFPTRPPAITVDVEAYRLTAEFSAARASHGLLAVPFGWQLGHALLGLPVLLAAGTGLLRGRRWAAWLAAIWIAGVLLLTLVVLGWRPGFFVKLATSVLLLAPLATPRSRAWFGRDRAEAAAKADGDPEVA